jgi:signal transduction histidine kinase
VQKHACAARVVVRVTAQQRSLSVSVTDDGIGGANRAGAGLRGLADRVEALGGEFVLDSPAGGGTNVRAEIPYTGQRSTGWPADLAVSRQEASNSPH